MLPTPPQAPINHNPVFRIVMRRSARVRMPAGSLEEMSMRPGESDGSPRVDEADTELLKLLTEGLTNGEIAEDP